MQAHLLQILILLIGFTYIHAGNFLTEKPDVLESCSFDGPKFKECLISNLQVIFINWTHGLPGSNIIGPVDPFTIKRLILSRSSPSDDSNPVNVDTDVQNVLVSGVSQAKIVDASYLPKNNKTEVLLWIPKLRIDFDYSVKGNVGGRKLDDHSKGHVKIEKLLIAFDVDIASQVTPKGNFIDVQHVSVSFREIGKLKFKVNKLFGGDKYLEQLTHNFINENWVEFYISWRPIIEYVIETMVFLRSRKIFSYIPAEYLIDNYALLESIYCFQANVLVPCSLDDSNISNCLAKNLQDIFINWADGIPGKDVFGLTDPFNLDNYIETKEISGFDGRPITIHNEFLNFSVKGLSQGIISAASYGDGIATASLDIPKLILNFDFKATIEDASDLVACSLEDAKFNECLVKNLQTIFINWKDGIPGSDIVGPIDPFTIKFDIWTKILNNELFSKYLGNGTDFKDIVVKGMSQATITEASYDPTKYEAKVVFKIPKLIFHVDYKLTISGGVNNLQISTKGSSSLELARRRYQKRVRCQRRSINDDVYDAYWREWFKTFKTFFDPTAESLLLQRVKKISSSPIQMRRRHPEAVEMNATQKSSNPYCLFYGLFAIFLCNEVVGVEYFTEKPSFLPSCRIKDPEFTTCSTNSIQKLIDQMNIGIPELLNTFGPLDPMRIRDIIFKQDNNNVATLNCNLTDVHIKGYSKMKIKESRVSKKDFSWQTKIFLPKTRMESKYKMEGRILVIPLSGSGNMVMEVENLNVIMLAKTHLYEKGGFTFYNITSIKTKLNMTRIYTNMDNLFNGRDKEIERSTNEFFNENWREVYEAFRPLITETVETVLMELLSSVFSLIPANYFIEDIPTPKQLYGDKGNE
ncbi:uncharacterized protein LOC133836706 [Drosophila sulfurigaster albostrigata]|uniref:uncharacterized protein LOC133836706 n=1 Tax=Drosophila sulfurigaster albostrigata TaxID=89887 RepID=UPI002D21C5C3|nr:uncharacterized protein LOC133836706 [Drosophila sulfurigaster albostrigata]